MNDHEVESALRTWLDGERGSSAPPALRMRIAAIPSSRGSPWHVGWSAGVARPRSGKAHVRTLAVLVGVAALLVAIVGGAALSGGGWKLGAVGPDPSPSVLSSANASIGPSASPALRMPAVCAAGSETVVSGAAMPSPSATPDGFPTFGAGYGAFFLQAFSGGEDLWSFGGDRPPTRIASVLSIAGADIIDVQDLSSDGSLVLFRVGYISPQGLSYECGDLYVAAADGSGVRRITSLGTSAVVQGGAISPDGTRVAYVAGDVAVVDLVTGSTVHQPGCAVPYSAYRTPVVWSSTVDRFAVACDPPVIYDAAAATSPTVLESADTLLGLAWSGGVLSVARVNGGSNEGGFHLDRFDAVTGQTIEGQRTSDASINWVVGGSSAFSPDGRQVLTLGVPGGQLPAASFSLYLVDVAGTTPRAIVPYFEGTVTWLSDGRSIIVFNLADGVWTLARIDLASGRRTSLGPLPQAYVSGIWRP